MSFLLKYKYIIFLILILPTIIKNPMGNLLPLLVLGLAVCMGKFYEFIKKHKK